ncbi:MAG TPA: NADH-quinone oxidoreductase subunit L, partial [Acidimicrobiales bacterium]|nr:NADH-quinone oxidoreductase subunit L [Acidimicrobiales bacterium]
SRSDEGLRVLAYGWVIPAVMVLSFALILFFGKRLPRKGHEIGLAAIAIAFVLSSVCAVEWVGRPSDLTVAPAAAAAEHGEAEKSGDGEHGTQDVDEHGTSPIAAQEEGPHAEEEDAEHGTTPAVSEPDEGGGHGGEEAGHEAEPIRTPVVREGTWFENGPVKINAGIHMDGLAVVMLFVVTLISLAVHVFSTSYMHDDRRYTHFFAALSLFTAGMLIMVTAGNTLQLLFGWEMMGLCSFMLIGHWWEEKNNSDAALKAFFTTRTGDIGLLVGISILFFAAGTTFDIATTNRAALSGDIGHTVLLAAAGALFCAVVGKSAQFPLHTWLPDAMAGPTPVSALIHAATMVVAGVYLVARLYGVFWSAFDIGGGGINPIALIGGITVIIAALLAFVQSDIKKVLAYSTVSQLGYMVMALGVGAWTAGIFHLFTHAFFKGLLFLGAGSVSHAVHSFDMKKDMGGMRTAMPTTYKTFMVGTLALAGIFPLAGFWSKDEILLGAGQNGYELFLVVGLIGAFMTAAYMTRCVYLTFFGEFRGHGHPHESPPAITIPLVVLAVLSATAGLLNAPGVDLFSEWTRNEAISLAGVAHHEFSIATAVIGMAFGLAGITASYLYYWRNLGPHRLTERSGAAMAGYRILENKYYLDRLYTDGIVGSIKGPVARAAYIVNQRVIDGVVNAAGIGTRKLGNFTYDVIDQKGVDGVVNGVGLTAEEGGSLLRVLQTGRVQQYAAFLFGGVALLGGALVLFT